MAWEVSLLPAARRQLARLDPNARRCVGKLIDLLAKEPRPAGVKALKGARGLLRVRSGDYRVEDSRLLVLVVAIGHHREVYRSV